MKKENTTVANLAAKQVTEQMIAEWKKKYPEGVFEITVEDKKCWLHYPDLRTLQFALSEQKRAGGLGFAQAIIANCWLAGDEEIKTQDAYYFGLVDSLDELIQLPDYEITRVREGDEVLNKVTVGDYTCHLKTPSRSDLEALSRTKKPNEKPLDKNIKLLEMVWVKGDAELKAQNHLYAALLTAVNELQEKKVSSVKKH